MPTIQKFTIKCPCDKGEIYDIEKEIYDDSEGVETILNVPCEHCFERYFNVTIIGKPIEDDSVFRGGDE